MYKKINDKYEIDKFGNVRNIKSKKILKWELNSKGYARVYLDRKNRVRPLIHRLVAKTFLGDLKNKVVDHIDNDRLNNCVDNLRICTQQENVLYYYREQRGK